MSDAELREKVREQIAALLQSARDRGIPADVAGRMLLQELTQAWLRDRSIDDVASELRFVADNLDPESDFEFMRP